jgi:predicted unusual protein kinase regulating ubiquinone biosynthesis (AarF/ABC1/UbiB family)
VLLEELSYKHEAYNAERFAAMFKDDMNVYIPSVYHRYSTDRVLVMEDVTSIKINDYAALEKAGIDRKVVARRMMETYLTQVFDHYFFHADPHPGNLFIYPLPVDDENADFGPQGRPFYLIFVDFGMTGTLTREIADGMVSTLSAVLTRDPAKLVRSYVELGFILPGADIPRIEQAARATFDQVWGMSMTEMRDMDYTRVADLASEFSELIFAMPFYIPQDFIYLGRTVSILSGMCTSLDPAYNPWHELQPHTEKLIARGFGIDVPREARPLDMGVSVLQSLIGGTGAQALRVVGEEVVRRTLGPLNRGDALIQKIERGDVHVVAELSLAHRQQLRRLERASHRTSRMIVFGSILISSTLLYVSDYTTVGAIGFALAGLITLVNFLKD